MLRSMGRKRTTDKHLPWRMYRHGGGYRFIPPAGPAVALGSVYAEALRRYADVVMKYRGGAGPDLRTMGDVLDRYGREIVPTKAESTQETNRYELGKLRAVFGQMTPAAVKPKHIYGYMDKRPPTRANREVALLSHVFRQAIRWGAVESNPCRDVQRNKERARERYVTGEEFWTVHDMAQPMLRAMMLLAATCGLRISELLALRWDQVRADGIHIQRGKGGKRQILKRNPSVDAALEQARAARRRGGVTLASAFVICRRDGKPYSKDGIESMWARLQAAWREAGGEPFQIRDLRAKSGSDHATGQHLGHRGGRVLDRHYRRRPETVEVLDLTREDDGMIPEIFPATPGYTHKVPGDAS